MKNSMETQKSSIEYGPKGLCTFKLLGSKIVILPWLSIKYLAISIIILFASVIIFNKALLPVAVAQGNLVSTDWQEENNRINKNMYKKNLATIEFPVWHSKGIPLPAETSENKRILLMGDSFVWGDGYANVNDIWWRQLERELHQRGYTHTEVIAAGMCGWSTHQQLDAAAQLVNKYNPDLIIWGYVTNDPDEYVVKLITPEQNQEAENAGNEVLIGQMKQQLETLRKNKEIEEAESDLEAYSYNEWENKLLKGKNLELYTKTVQNLAEYQKSINIPGFMMTLPNHPGKLSFDNKYAPIIPLYENAKYPFYNIITEFEKKYPDHKPPAGANILAWGINPANGHPGVYSTRFYAEKAADYIENFYPQCLGEKSVNTDHTKVVKINDWMPYSLDLYQQAETSVYTFEYPDSEEYMMHMPINSPYIQLNLEIPVQIKSIKLEGTGLTQASLYITTENPVYNVDSGIMTELGKGKAGRKLSWDLDKYEITEKVSTIRLSAIVSPTDRKLTLSIIPMVTDSF